MKKKQKTEKYWKEIITRIEGKESIASIMRTEKLARKTIMKYFEKYSDKPLTLTPGPVKGMKKYKLSKIGYYPENTVPTLTELTEAGVLSENIVYDVLTEETKELHNTAVDKIEDKKETKKKRRIFKL